MMKWKLWRDWISAGTILGGSVLGISYAVGQMPQQPAEAVVQEETVNVGKLARAVMTFYSQTPKGIIAVGRGVVLDEGILLTTHSNLLKSHELHLRTSEARMPIELAVLAEESSVHAALIEAEGLDVASIEFGAPKPLQIDDEVWMLNGVNQDLWRPARVVSIRRLPLGQSIYRVAGAFYDEDEGSLMVSVTGEPIGIVADVVDGIEGAQVIPLSIALGLIQKAKPVPFKTYVAYQEMKTLAHSEPPIVAQMGKSPTASGCLMPLHHAVKTFYQGVDALVLATVSLEESGPKQSLKDYAGIQQSQEFFRQSQEVLHTLKCRDADLDEVRRNYYSAAQREYFAVQAFVSMIRGAQGKDKKVDLASIKQHLGAMIQEVSGLQTSGLRFAEIAQKALANEGEQMVPLLDVSLMMKEKQATLPRLNTAFWLSTAQTQPVVLAVTSEKGTTEKDLQSGDVLLGVRDGEGFTSLRDFYTYILKKQVAEEFELRVRRNEKEVFVMMQVQE